MNSGRKVSVISRLPTVVHMELVRCPPDDEVDPRWLRRMTVLAGRGGRGALVSASGLSMKLWRLGRPLQQLRVGTD